jgi:hypothetical protein
MTPDQASIRSKDQQVTEGRFQAPHFDANVQTDKELVIKYVAVEKAEQAIVTTPVNIVPPKELRAMMV